MKDLGMTSLWGERGGSLGCSLSVFTSAVPYICAQRGWCGESGPPSLTLSKSLGACATIPASAAAGNHGHNGCRIYSPYLRRLVAT